MKVRGRLILFASALAFAAAALGACGGMGKGEQAVTAGGGAQPGGGPKGSAGGTDRPCPKEADVAAAVGYPVRQKPYGTGCHYETPDSGTSVSLMRVSTDRADLLLEQMRGEARGNGAEVVAIEVGGRGHAWATNTRGFGFTVAGDRAYMVDVATDKVDVSRDKKADIVRVLRMMVD